MPLYFWNDPTAAATATPTSAPTPVCGGTATWITLTSHGSVIVHGRSDATLNRNGVRLGSADIHDVVERLPEITEALVIGAEEPDGRYWMPLFVVLADGVTLDDLPPGPDPRSDPHRCLTPPRPRRDPRRRALPHTKTGKKLEVPVKRLLQGAPVEQVLNPVVVDNPDLIAYFARLGAERNKRPAHDTLRRPGEHRTT